MWHLKGVAIVRAYSQHKFKISHKCNRTAMVLLNIAFSKNFNEKSAFNKNENKSLGHLN